MKKGRNPSGRSEREADYLDEERYSDGSGSYSTSRPRNRQDSSHRRGSDSRDLDSGTYSDGSTGRRGGTNGDSRYKGDPYTGRTGDRSERTQPRNGESERLHRGDSLASHDGLKQGYANMDFGSNGKSDNYMKGSNSEFSDLKANGNGTSGKHRDTQDYKTDRTKIRLVCPQPLHKLLFCTSLSQEVDNGTY
jgi:hypothetical protein